MRTPAALAAMMILKPPASDDSIYIGHGRMLDVGKPRQWTMNAQIVHTIPPQWSPDGTQIAYIARGDLFTVEITERNATPRKKLAVGEKLTPQEEEKLAVGNLKLIGLGILEYTQDNAEQYPAQDGWRDAVMPYLKDDPILQIGSAQVIYLAPTDLRVAAMREPGSTVIATITLSSGTYGLFGDGHVKNLHP